MTTVWIMSTQIRKLATATTSKCLPIEMLRTNGSNDPEGVAFGYEVDGQAKRERPIMARRDWHEEEDRRANKRS